MTNIKLSYAWIRSNRKKWHLALLLGVSTECGLMFEKTDLFDQIENLGAYIPKKEICKKCAAARDKLISERAKAGGR